MATINSIGMTSFRSKPAIMMGEWIRSVHARYGCPHLQWNGPDVA
jgi:hypothetical protein